MRLKLVFTIFLMFLAVGNAQSAVTSYDHTFVANDVFSADFHTRLNANFNRSLTGGINNINSANILDDSLLEADMADEINPRIRTYEGAACEYVYEGLLPVTSASLTSNTSAGTAYPRGFRINKASATAKTYTASRWTFVDIDSSGNFQYSEQTIDGSTPSVASNSIRLARVSTDGSTVVSVSDLRRTSCANGPFSAISDASGEATLSDVLKNGSPVRKFSHAGRTPVGFAQGAFVSWDSHTAFKVTSGSLYINGKYRSVSTDISVPTTADAPTTGISGVDTTISASTKYCVYAVADQDSVKGYSITYSANCSAPAGVTSYRLIGSIDTDATSLFTSNDVFVAHGFSPKETLGASAFFNGASSTIPLIDTFNIASWTDNGVGDYTATFDKGFRTANYSAVATGYDNDVPVTCNAGTVTRAVGSYRFAMYRAGTGTATDCEDVNLQIFGDITS